MNIPKLSKRLAENLQDGSLLKQIKRLSKDSLFGVIDQGFFSTTNFLINIYFGRWLSESDYGAYAIVFTIFLILSTFQSSLIFEPMAVFGPGDFHSNGKTYFKSLVMMQIVITTGISVLLLVSSVFAAQPMKNPLMSLAVSITFILLYWFFRQACYVESRPGIAAITSALYSAFTLGGLFFCRRFGLTQAATPFLLMAAGSLVASAAAILLLQARLTSDHKLSLRQIFIVHWEYGKWFLASTIPNSISTFIYIPMIGVMIGLTYSGAYRAIQNLVLPLQQIFAVLTLLFLPRLSKLKYAGDEKGVARTSLVFLVVNTTVLIGFFAVLIPFRAILVTLLYQNAFYTSFASLVPLWGISLFLAILIQTITNLLRISKLSRYVLYAKIGSASVVLLAGFLFIRRFHLTGALAAILVSMVVELVILTLLYFQPRGGGISAEHHPLPMDAVEEPGEVDMMITGLQLRTEGDE
ncbi:MAG: oligosaccharide flippase family protein [Chloroflexi bacterium]|nr:oligosaccharide flippase family protein [Chloroflexota bacterium]